MAVWSVRAGVCLVKRRRHRKIAFTRDDQIESPRGSRAKTELEFVRVLIDVWSDYVCPFCYLEEPVLKQVKERYGEQVEIKWRAYELRPEPVPTLEPNGRYLQDIWARAVHPMAKERGMVLHLPPVQPRSRLAHEAAQFADTQGLASAMNKAVFAAFFENGRDIGDPATLVEIGKSVGLHATQLQDALDDGRFRASVLAEEELALKLGISGVPAMLIRRGDEPLEQALEISGAQTFASVKKILDRVAANSHS